MKESFSDRMAVDVSLTDIFSDLDSVEQGTTGPTWPAPASGGADEGVADEGADPARIVMSAHGPASPAIDGAVALADAPSDAGVGADVGAAAAPFDASRAFAAADDGEVSSAAVVSGGSGQPSAEFVSVAAKLGGDLASLALGLAAGPGDLAGSNAAASLGLARAPLDMTVIGGMVAIDASSADGDIDGLLAQLEGLGLQHGSTWGNTLSGLLPIDALADAAGLATLNQARAAMAMPNVGLVTSQGDASMHADDARSTFGIDGTGVTVGVMSDSFDNLGGAGGGVASGDLPGGVNVLLDLDGGGTDEGRGMAEIVHDVAPGAAIQFRTAFLGQADFANGIQQLVAAGSDIVVDDIFYYAEPFFQDGVIAQSADLAVRNGISYFTAAGNQGDDSYQATFNDSGQTISYTNKNSVAITDAHLHDFDPGAGVDTLQSFSFAGKNATGGATNSFRIGLQWDDPFSSVSAANGGAVNDFDLLLTDSAGAIVPGLTASSSVIGGDAFEFFDINYNGAAPAQFNLAITRAAGSGASLLKTVIFDETGFSLDEYDTHSSTTVGHSNAGLAQGVGAADFENTPEFGVAPPVNEDFSSLGGTPTVFDTFGNRLASPVIRQGVDITAPDGADTTFFGSDTSDPGSFPNFFGTSAAAPHAAAVAALLLERNPNATPDDIFTALQASGIDMGAAGVDQLSGAGLIQAGAAVAALNLNDILAGTNAADTLNGFAGNDVLMGKGGADTLNGGAGQDVLIGGAGDDLHYVDIAADAVVEVAGGGSDRVLSSVDYTLGVGQDIERLTTTLTVGTGAINLTGNDLGQFIQGNQGVNIIDGKGGVDTLQGFGGADFYYVDSASDQVIEAAGGGTDAVYAFVNYTLAAATDVEVLNTSATVSTGAVNLTGNGLVQTINGNHGANIIDGRGGADTMKGFAGDDAYYVDNASDVVIEAAGQGTDAVYASVDYTLAAAADVEALNTSFSGGTAAINLKGNELAQTVRGNAGNNSVYGGGGNDTLIGGLGRDAMKGEAGNDVFDFNAVAETGITASTRDKIADFTHGQDIIDLSTIDGTAGAPGDAFNFIGVAGFNHVAGELRYVQVNNVNNALDETIIEADVDGNGIANFQIALTGLVNLVVGDFVV